MAMIQNQEFTKSNCEFMSEDVRALMQAMLEAREEFKPTGKNKKTHAYKYADGEAVYDAVIPYLAKYKIEIKQVKRITASGEWILISRLIHTPTGQWCEDVAPLISEKPGNQAFGSCITYQRRYALLSLCGIFPEEDDDCNDEQKYIDEKQMETLTKDQAKKLSDHLSSFSNADFMAENIYKFNKVSKLQELRQTRYLSVMKYIDENGKK